MDTAVPTGPRLGAVAAPRLSPEEQLELECFRLSAPQVHSGKRACNVQLLLSQKSNPLGFVHDLFVQDRVAKKVKITLL